MKLVEVTDISVEGLMPYAKLTERELRSGICGGEQLFVAESPKVISVALDAGYEPVSLLCEERHIDGDASGIISRIGSDVPLYWGSREVLCKLTGYTLTRGVLCAMRRKALPSAEEVCRDARRVAVIDGVCDTTNIGAIFRSAAALGIDGVLL
ncbi:MAG TPA: rRNA methyltransferase, partial [Porphyromonadaceae bacterium]|nr:rRNA methyltransferase [Porphyromonadaceae bacterium]